MPNNKNAQNITLEYASDVSNYFNNEHNTPGGVLDDELYESDINAINNSFPHINLSIEYNPDYETCLGGF